MKNYNNSSEHRQDKTEWQSVEKYNIISSDTGQHKTE